MYELTKPRRKIIQKALLCYTSHILDVKYKSKDPEEASQAKKELSEVLKMVEDFKELQKRDFIDDLDDENVPFDDMKIIPVK